LLPNLNDLPVADERDQPLGQRTAYARVAKGPQLGFPLFPITCDVAFIHIARVTAQLGDAVPDLRTDNLFQVLNADLLRVRLTVPLTVNFETYRTGECSRSVRSCSRATSRKGANARGSRCTLWWESMCVGGRPTSDSNRRNCCCNDSRTPRESPEALSNSSRRSACSPTLKLGRP